MNRFQGPMRPFPGLEGWSKTVVVPDASGMRLHLYDTGGEGKQPVLLLHGLGDEADTWRHVLPRIAATCRGVAPDLPGFGRSAQEKRGHTVPFFADTLFALLDQLGLSRVALVGHSMGAVIAHEMALRRPERVKSLVLIGGTLVSGANRPDLSLLLFLAPGLGEWMYNRLRKDPQAAYRSLEGYYSRLEALPQADRDFLYQRVNERVWSDGQRRGFLSALRGLAGWLPGQQKGLPARVEGLRVPTTILWGAEDRIQPVANARALQRMQPSARLEIVPGAGHNLQQERPEVVAGVILAAAVS